MIILDNLGRFKKGILWINKIPEIKYNTVEILKLTKEAKGKIVERDVTVALELLLGPRDISNYVLLGVRYTSSKDNVLKVNINVSDFDDVILSDRIASSVDEVHAGIPREYALAIINEVEKLTDELGCSSGTLSFDIGAHGHIGSSRAVFAKATRILMKLISVSSYDNREELKEIVSSELKNP